MFPRTKRVHRTTDILRVFRQGERIRVGSLTLFYLPDTKSEDIAKATVVVDKKLSKKAVVRNRVKRQLRAILQQQSLRPGMYVLRGFEGTEILTSKQLQSAVTQALSRLK